ncbi:MAG: hypothetical protein JW809_19145 [Pirellulales bacterium]|nr:hypothetical protein [Pirellulales bacterium]
MNAVFRAMAGLLAIAAVGLVNAQCVAGECCSHCGGETHVRKVCRPVWATRLVEVVCWDVVCEEICLPGKTPRASRDGKPVACPDCKTRTRQKLVRKTVVQEVPVLVWVVEYVCVPCARGATSDDAAAPTPALRPTRFFDRSPSDEDL